MSSSTPCGVAVLLLLVCAGGAAVRADGDEFFLPHSSALNADGTRKEASGGFMGTVKDEAGGYIFDATVTIAVRVDTEDGPQRVAITCYTNEIGHYRSFGPDQIVLDLLQIETKVPRENVEIVSVEKEGYVEVRRLNRGVIGKKTGPTQVDVVMRRVRSPAEP